ncbi:hypothetical protein [Nocardia terpenica]|uniref:Uncharacterized protein n=1 Tax=Nocardia terpenica TaxID=455432 RepID=A0A6G9ZDI0_9NOCA|nr:hypothetical protein [Nocardia terpenica]QIS23675.1 hypothetical protein F6W96_40785 [Nocardia terpenica]
MTHRILNSPVIDTRDHAEPAFHQTPSPLHGIAVTVYRPTTSPLRPGLFSTENAQLTVIGIIDATATGAGRFTQINTWTEITIAAWHTIAAIIIEDHGNRRQAHLEPVTWHGHHTARHHDAGFRFGGNYAGNTSDRYTDVLNSAVGYPIPGGLLPIHDSAPRRY